MLGKKGNIWRYEKHSDQAFSRHLGYRDQNNNLLQSPERWPSHWRMIYFNDDQRHNLVHPAPSAILKAYIFPSDFTTLSHMPTMKCIDARRKQVAHFFLPWNESHPLRCCPRPRHQMQSMPIIDNFTCFIPSPLTNDITSPAFVRHCAKQG